MLVFRQIVVKHDSGYWVSCRLHANNDCAADSPAWVSSESTCANMRDASSTPPLCLVRCR